MCVSCVFLMFSGIHIQKAEVLSARFPKEYDHKNLAAKHPKLCTYFIQNSVYLWFFHTSIHTYMHACTHAHLLMVWVFSKDMYRYKKYIHTYMCVSCVFLMFSRIHIQKAEVLSVRFPKEYDHKNLAAKHPKLCTYFIQNSVYLWFFHTSILTYMHACTHAHLLMVWFFPEICINTKTNTYMCVPCVFLMFSRIHIQKAEVLSVWFPKEYDHKNLAAKHPKLCTYFIQNSVYLWFFHTSIHTYMHACTHAHLLMVWVFSKDMYKYKKIHTCVSCVFLMFSRIHIQKQRF